MRTDTRMFGGEMRTLKLGAIALSLCLPVLLSNCATMSAWANLQSPQVELERIQVKSVGVTGGMFDVTLRVKNPNAVTLDGTGLTTTIDVKGSRFAQVDLSNAFSLP